MAGQHAPIAYHRALVDDATRVHAWDRAIRAAVHPGQVVLDAGTGTGLLAVLAARRGARVHAVEAADVAGVAAAVVAAHGLGGQITVHRADLEQLPPVEPVDVVLCDLIGAFLPDGSMRGTARACAAWMRPDARFLPGRITLRAAAIADVRMPEIDAFRAPIAGVDLGAALPYALNTAYRSDLAAAAVLSDVVQVAVIEPPEVPDRVIAELDLEVPRAALLRGFAGWFFAELYDGVTLDTAPGQVTSWHQTVWPIAPVHVRPGDRIRATLEAASAPIGVDFAWRGTVERDGRLLADFDHSSEPRLGERGGPSAREPLDRDAVIDTNRRGAEALLAGQLDVARALLGAATIDVPDDLAPPVFENLGLVHLNAGDPAAALHAFLRALDGVPASREQSLRYLVVCLAQLGRADEAGRWLQAYEASFGPHPDARRS